MPDTKIESLFPPRSFNDSSISNILLTKEVNIMTIFRSPQKKELYDTFDEIFSTYLSKLPQNNVKKYVSTAFNKNLIFIGNSTGAKSSAIFARLLIRGNSDKLTGIVLDANSLDIDIMTGETNAADDCIYASYFGMIRSAVLLNVEVIAKDFGIHKLLCNYIYFMILKAVGKSTIFNEKQKTLVYIVCVYLFYKHFFQESHSAIASKIKNQYKDIFKQEFIKEFLPLLKDISKYDTIRDIPRALIDLNIYHDDPRKVILELLQKLGSVGFYNMLSSLDQLIPMIIISRYPTNLYTRHTLTSSRVHDALEGIISKFINKMQYDKFSYLYKDH